MNCGTNRSMEIRNKKLQNLKKTYNCQENFTSQCCTFFVTSCFYVSCFSIKNRYHAYGLATETNLLIFLRLMNLNSIMGFEMEILLNM